jgi:hypothetical protein
MMPQPHLISVLFRWVVTVAAGYVTLANLTGAMASLVGFIMLRGVRPPLTEAQAKTLSISPMLPGISFLIDGRSPLPELFDRIDSLMRMPYANFEIIAACAEVCDQDIAALVNRYHLVRSSHPKGFIPGGAQSATFESRAANRFVVVAGESENLWTNSALAFAHMPLVGAVETDLMPTDEGLITLMRPFLDNRDAPPPACAGLTMSTVAAATGDAPRLIYSGAPIIGIIDQVSAATCAVAMGGFGGTLPSPGDFVLFERAALTRAGGFRRSGVADQAALDVMTTYVALIREARKHHTARTVFIPHGVATRTAPRSASELSRRRTDRMVAELCVLRSNPGAVLNPASGSLGMLTLPVALGALLLPGIELLGYAATAIGLALGIISAQLAALYLLAAAGFGLLRALILVALSLCRPVFAAEPISALSAVSWSILDVAGLRQAAACRFLFGLIFGGRGWAARSSADPGKESFTVASISGEGSARSAIRQVAPRESRPAVDRADQPGIAGIADASLKRSGVRT